MIWQTVNQYRIIDQLGEGGMGVVYLAEDTRLHRKAVLKFISGSLNSTVEVRERFDREAQAAARLSHPNVCTVYELGDVVASLARNDLLKTRWLWRLDSPRSKAYSVYTVHAHPTACCDDRRCTFRTCAGLPLLSVLQKFF